MSDLHEPVGGASDEPVSDEPLGGAESTPDPTPFDRPDRDPKDPGAEELGGSSPGGSSLGGSDTVAANDQLDGEVER